jgi:aquaporin Z
MKNYLTEFLGTFFLVLIICFSVSNVSTEIAPLAIGLGLMAIVYMGGPISKAHYNPAVTLGFFMRGSISSGEGLAYVISQTFGALLAAFIFWQMSGSALTMGPAAEFKDYHYVKPIIMEVIFTFFLVLTILNVATSEKTKGNDYYGIAIGTAVMAGIFCAGPISGGALNPAVGIGLCLVDGLDGNNGTNSMVRIWWYLVGPFIGGALASVVYRMINPDEF